MERFQSIKEEIAQITKTALILWLKPEVFNRAIFEIENGRTKVRGIKPRPFSIIKQSPIEEVRKVFDATFK